eukprot:TRINITY_DN56913_c0_g1_i1.p1 TRINITY_DN56913_c0_g1~~TRINITY_DN56913_c0_g1_i1.p1  ORF type:complete len:355 (+),score=128.50 TRINITY_DN56913_c0_g1_i1:74-1066(+)
MAREADGEVHRQELETRITQDEETSPAIHATCIMMDLIRKSAATTHQELLAEIQAAAGGIQRGGGLVGRYRIQLLACSDMFLRYVTSMTTAEIYDMSVEVGDIRKLWCKRAETFLSKCSRARQEISKHLNPFLRDKATILIHGFSRTVLRALQDATSSQNRRLSVIVTESRPECAGYAVLSKLKDYEREAADSIQAKLILDAAVGQYMPSVDFVLFGAEGVSESGGVINKVGSYQIAVLARALQKPVYVATETFKLLRVFPLDQSEVPQSEADGYFNFVDNVPKAAPSGAEICKGMVDYVPPQYVTQLYTDLGILTPSAVSDEIIKLSRT